MPFIVYDEGMEVITNADSRFPAQLLAIKPAVKRLNYLGEWDEGVFDKCVAIVGTRRMTGYGERMVERIVPELVEAGMTIVSGFMYGIDQKAHQVCTECGGRTVAVLGWGIQYKFSSYEEQFSEITDKGGLVISEWEKEVPRLWMFAYRNRIVAGLSQAVLVVEAAEKSGSLITAERAFKFGRKLLAVPGPATSTLTEGTNGLIKSGQAEMVRSGSEVLAALKLQIPNNKIQTSSNDQMVKLLKEEAMTIDEIAKKLRSPVEKIIQELGMLELRGVINSRDGKYYVDQG